MTTISPDDLRATNLPPIFSDDALALRFSDRHGDHLQYVAAWNRWLRWTGKVWRQDVTHKIFDLARALCREAAAEANQGGKALASAKVVAAVVTLARVDRRHAAEVDQWDAAPWVLNTPDGTVDLKTGKMHKHRPEDYITKMTAVGPGGKCRRWLKFLDEITDGDEDLQAFLQRMLGYCLTGSTREHALFFLHGTGANGKSVLLNTVTGILGEFHRVAPVEMLLASPSERHPTELAGLMGRRLVTAIELDQGRRWAEAKIKALTGGDRIAARYMRQDFFEFEPSFKLIVAGNHKPSLTTVDEAIRRRFNLVPFAVTIPPEKRDPDLPEKLKDEWPGILDWMIEGCLDWQQRGLDPPSSVRGATAEYMAAQDVVRNWLDECTAKDSRGDALSSELFTSWRTWCEANGEHPGGGRNFSQKLVEAGLKKRHSMRGAAFLGVRVIGP